MTDAGVLHTAFPTGCFVWVPWRRVWYMARVVDGREAPRGAAFDAEVLIHVHGEQATTDKWLPVSDDHSGAAAVVVTVMGTPKLRLLNVLPTALTGVGSLPPVGAYVQLLVMDQSLMQRLVQRLDADTVLPKLTGVVARVLPARDASVVDVAYPSERPEQQDQAQWQRVQIGNGYISVISESRFYELQSQLAAALDTTQ